MWSGSPYPWKVCGRGDRPDRFAPRPARSSCTCLISESFLRRPVAAPDPQRNREAAEGQGRRQGGQRDEPTGAERQVAVEDPAPAIGAEEGTAEKSSETQGPERGRLEGGLEEWQESRRKLRLVPQDAAGHEELEEEYGPGSGHEDLSVRRARCEPHAGGEGDEDCGDDGELEDEPEFLSVPGRQRGAEQQAHRQCELRQGQEPAPAETMAGAPAGFDESEPPPQREDRLGDPSGRHQAEAGNEPDGRTGRRQDWVAREARQQPGESRRIEQEEKALQP